MSPGGKIVSHSLWRTTVRPPPPRLLPFVSSRPCLQLGLLARALRWGEGGGGGRRQEARGRLLGAGGRKYQEGCPISDLGDFIPPSSKLIPETETKGIQAKRLLRRAVGCSSESTGHAFLTARRFLVEPGTDSC